MYNNFFPAKTVLATFLFILMILTHVSSSQSNVYLDINVNHRQPPPLNEEAHHPFTIESATASLIVSVSSILEQGRCQIKIIDPLENEVSNFSWGKGLTLNSPVNINRVTGVYTLEITSDDVIGMTAITLAKGDAIKTAQTTFPVYNIIGGALMILIGVGFVIGWYYTKSVGLRWFWIGAGIWLIGVVLKFAFAVPLNTPILQGLGSLMPHWAFLTVGSFYIGLLTGVFEIGITLLIALYWRGMAQNSSRAIAVGIGAGAIEAVLLGLGVVVAASMGVGGTGLVLAMVGPIERLLTIFLHMASRALTLLTVATGKMKYFWAGFFLLTIVDSIAGWVHLSEYMKTHSVWWIELVILPFTLLSIAILRWCIQNWPKEIKAE